MNEFVAIEQILSWIARTFERFLSWMHQSLIGSLLAFACMIAVVGFGTWAFLDYINPNGSHRPKGQTSAPKEAPADRRFRERIDASFKACLEAGGVPIMASHWAGGEMNDCKFPPQKGCK